ncbi:MAG: hypothetical protein WC254_06605 [Candidatus Woesearchaeota archaeon]|jgi:hypothetical protein
MIVKGERMHGLTRRQLEQVVKNLDRYDDTPNHEGDFLKTFYLLAANFRIKDFSTSYCMGFLYGPDVNDQRREYEQDHWDTLLIDLLDVLKQHYEKKVRREVKNFDKKDRAPYDNLIMHDVRDAITHAIPYAEGYRAPCRKLEEMARDLDESKDDPNREQDFLSTFYLLAANLGIQEISTYDCFNLLYSSDPNPEYYRHKYEENHGDPRLIVLLDVLKKHYEEEVTRNVNNPVDRGYYYGEQIALTVRENIIHAKQYAEGYSQKEKERRQQFRKKIGCGLIGLGIVSILAVGAYIATHNSTSVTNPQYNNNQQKIER